MKYAEKFKDPRWQKKRLQILERDEWCCQSCGDAENTLHVHHRWYEKAKDPWNYTDDCLVTLCEGCHQDETDYIAEQVKCIGEFARRRFLAGEINMLAFTILEMPMIHMPEVLLTAIDFHLRDKDRLQKLVDIYMEDLSRRANVRREQEQDNKSGVPDVSDDKSSVSNIPC